MGGCEKNEINTISTEIEVVVEVEVEVEVGKKTDTSH